MNSSEKDDLLLLIDEIVDNVVNIDPEAGAYLKDQALECLDEEMTSKQVTSLFNNGSVADQFFSADTDEYHRVLQAQQEVVQLFNCFG